MTYKYTTPPGSLLTGSLAAVINRPEFNNLPLSAAAIGYNADTGAPYYIDIASAPHVLIAGTTGSGKSVTMHDIIVSLIYKNTPATAEFYLIDPKMIELSLYENIPLVKRCDFTPAAALATLATLHNDMMKRYKAMRRAGVRDIAGTGYKRIYIFIDEIADLMFTNKKDTEKYISSIARLGRAAGFHIIAATQRPTRDVLTGQIKINMPARVALAMPAAVDSVTVLGHKGAETLKGRGDALIKTADSIELSHIQCAYISGDDIRKITEYCERQAPRRRGIFKKAV